MAGFEVTPHGRFCTDPRGKVRIYNGRRSSCLIDNDNKIMSLSSTFVITKSTRVVPSGCSGALGIQSSSRMGRPVEWPGVTEPGDGPRPLGGGEGRFEASIVSCSCARPTRITPGLSSTTKSTNSFNHCGCSACTSVGSAHFTASRGHCWQNWTPRCSHHQTPGPLGAIPTSNVPNWRRRRSQLRYMVT
jgi:hypothetical protein